MKISEKKNKKKKVCSSVTVGMGDPLINMAQFNKDFKSSPIEANHDFLTDTGDNTAVGEVSGDTSSAGESSGGEGGGMGESLLQEKRETKRYYIRPQHIFCANKADVLKALIDVSAAGENCSVYTLKNLDDHENVHELTNNDIIYYYDNDVLYDKNHVMVMDYDLFIKHEEERKKINKNPDQLTKQDYDQEYEDRMTKNTFVESMQNKISYDAFNLALTRGEEVLIGNTFDSGSRYVDDYSSYNYDHFEPLYYTNTEFVAYMEDGKYCLQSTDMDKYGGEGDIEQEYYDTIEDLIVAINNINFDYSDCELDLADEKYQLAIKKGTNNDPFDQTFEAYDIYGKKLVEGKEEEPKICCICGEEYEGYGNNAEPYKQGYCCDACNLHFVLPFRLAQSDNKEEK